MAHEVDSEVESSGVRIDSEGLGQAGCMYVWFWVCVYASVRLCVRVHICSLYAL